MQALLTNDDGLRAPGIISLRNAIAPLFDDLMTVAPLTVQSATSHGITFHEPLMVSRITVGEREQAFEGIAVDGRPADCSKLALTNLWPDEYGEGSHPDLVISGMNMGANCGINVIYSGTVAAAIEAAFLGVPSIAVSLHLGRGTPDYDTAAKHAASAISRVLEHGPLARHACININIPRTEFENDDRAITPPLVVCPMNVHGLVDKYERRTTPTGNPYYWAAGDGLDFREADAGSDVERLLNGCITVTPLSYDMTDGSALREWEERLD